MRQCFLSDAQCQGLGVQSFLLSIESFLRQVERGLELSVAPKETNLHPSWTLSQEVQLVVVGLQCKGRSQGQHIG